jgi:transcriptional regulator with XRE-family HTH domain
MRNNGKRAEKVKRHSKAGEVLVGMDFSGKLLHKPDQPGGRRSAVAPQLNVQEAARKAKVSASYLGRVLSGKQTPSLKAAQRIGKVLGVGIERVLEFSQSVRVANST